MNCQNKQITFDNYTQFNYETKNLDQLILKAINMSDKVYVFRSYNHLPKKNNLIQWLDSVETEKLKQLDIHFPQLKEVYEITAKNKEEIYCLILNDKIKSKFLELFKISIRDFRRIISPEALKNSLYIDDPLYDQYDFVFCNKNTLLLLTDIHPFIYLINNKILE